MAEPLHWRTAEELAGLFRAGRCSPVEATGAILRRVGEVDPKLRAFARLDAKGARAAARRAEEEMRRGVDRGPLHGVPVAVKELFAVRGLPFAAGTAVLRDRIAEEDAAAIARLRAAGAVLLGTLAMTEGAYVAYHPTVTPPRNPWNPDRWSGISSSGSGAATAAGLCFGSLGSDTGGSIRFPSAANGVVGLKPTYGRVPLSGVFLLSASLDHVGPIARSVHDAAVMLGIIAGFDRGDATSLRAPVPDYLADLEGGVRGVRIGVDEHYARAGLCAEVVDPILASTAIFEAAGAQIRAVRTPRWEEGIRDWAAICCAEVAVAHHGLFPERRADYGPELALFIEAGRALPAFDYARSLESKRRFAIEVEKLFDEIDLVLCPTLGIATPAASPDWSDAAVSAGLVRFTIPFNLSGSPTLSLPCGFAADGMPLSLQLVGRHLDEALLLRAGRLFERETVWHERHPPT
jgi:amidase